MAENKGITEVQALNAAIERFNPDCEGFDAEVVGKLRHMVEVRSRKRERKTDDSKRLANIALGEEFAAQWGDRGNFKAADVAATLGVSPAKASAVCKAMGWDTVPSTEKVNVYTL